MVSSSRSHADIASLLPSRDPAKLYESNPFRILGLSASASTNEAQNRAKKLAFQKKGRGEFDDGSLERAIQSLSDPRSRVAAEIFWYFPGGLRGEEACRLVLDGRPDEARQIWISAAAGSDPVEKGIGNHNLAVLFHQEALKNESEQAVSQSAAATAAWEKALKAWSRFADNTGGWSYLRQRARDMNDPLISDSFIDALRVSLPHSILAVNAGLAAKHLSSGNISGARRHLDLIRSSGFQTELCRAVCLEAVQSLKERVQDACERASAEVERDKFQGQQLYSDFTSRIEPDIRLLMKLDSDDALSTGPLRDEAADFLRNLAIEMHNTIGSVKATKAAVEIMEKALSIAASPVKRPRLEEERAQLRSMLGVVRSDSSREGRAGRVRPQPARASVTASDAASAYEDGLMRQEKASALQSRQDWYGAQSEWKAAESHYMTAMRADPNNRQYSNAADLARKSYEWCSVAPYARPPLVQLAGLVFVLIAYYVSLASLFNIPFAGEIQALILKDSWWEGMRTSAVVLAFFPFVARLFGKGSALAFVLTSIGGFYKRRHDAWRGLYAFLVGLFGIYLTTVGIVTHFLK